MAKKDKLEIENVIFCILYLVLVGAVIFEHNILDIVYLLALTFYLVRFCLCRSKKKKRNL